MEFRPLHDRVVVKRVEEEAKTSGGIIIPDTAKEKPQQGEVIAVGPGARDEAGKVNALDVKVGDRVLVRQVVGQRGQNRWRGAAHHEGERHPRHSRGQSLRQGGRLSGNANPTN